MAEQSLFWRTVEISKTALLLSDVQTQLLSHMSEIEQRRYLSSVTGLLEKFREHISQAKREGQGVPMIIHHVVSNGLCDHEHEFL